MCKANKMIRKSLEELTVKPHPNSKNLKWSHDIREEERYTGNVESSIWIYLLIWESDQTPEELGQTTAQATQVMTKSPESREEVARARNQANATIFSKKSILCLATFNMIEMAIEF